MCDVSWLLTSPHQQHQPSTSPLTPHARLQQPAPPPPATSPSREQRAQLSLCCAREVTQPHVLDLLLSIAKQQRSIGAASFACTLLASAALLEGEDKHVGSEARTALFRGDALQLLCQMIKNKGAIEHSHYCHSVFCSFFHRLLSCQPGELIQQLLLEHAVGEFLEAAPKPLGTSLVCQMLSSRGQRVMTAVEAQHGITVPLALCQVCVWWGGDHGLNLMPWPCKPHVLALQALPRPRKPCPDPALALTLSGPCDRRSSHRKTTSSKPRQRQSTTAAWTPPGPPPPAAPRLPCPCHAACC